ncbi:MAG: aromatic-ring-hydroxylating dioxygenase subunit beta [Caldimonas sp.]
MTTPGDAPSERELVDFVVREARLLDEKRYDEWLALWADDGLYWVPLTPDQVDGIHHNSHLHEDALLRTLRVERLKSPRAFAQQPPSRAHHLLQVPTVEASDAAAGRHVLRTMFHYTEAQGDETIQLFGTVFHHLVLRDGHLRIALKRVDLLNAEAALPAVQLFI